MKIIEPKPFTFEAGKRAVLLLHAFTGTTADVRMLGRYLQEKGYTCHAPLYKGHGVAPEQLIETEANDWWNDVVKGYEFLQENGFEEVAVCGLSLGGVFSLKVGYTLAVKGIIPMCAPVKGKPGQKIYNGVLQYARDYKKREQKRPEEIEKEMERFKDAPLQTLASLDKLTKEVREQLDTIHIPTFVIQARHDELIDTESATIIYESIQSEDKKLTWYEQSTHVITFSKEKEQLHEDIYQFLEQLSWKQ